LQASDFDLVGCYLFIYLSTNEGVSNSGSMLAFVRWFPFSSPIQVALTTAFLKIPLPLLPIPSLLCCSTGAVLVGPSGGRLCGALPYILTAGVAGASRRVRDYWSKKAVSLNNVTASRTMFYTLMRAHMMGEIPPSFDGIAQNQNAG
jgi:hypothetical protein